MQTKANTLLSAGRLNGLQAANCVLGLSHVLGQESFHAQLRFASCIEKDPGMAAEVLGQRHSASIALFVLGRADCSGYRWEQHVKAAAMQMQRIAVQHGIGQLPSHTPPPDGTAEDRPARTRVGQTVSGAGAGGGREDSSRTPTARGDRPDKGRAVPVTAAAAPLPSPLSISSPYLIAGLLHLAAHRRAAHSAFVREAAEALAADGALADLSLPQLDDLVWAAGALAIDEPELGRAMAERTAVLAPGLKRRELLGLCSKLAAMQCITPGLVQQVVEKTVASHPGLSILARLPVGTIAMEGPVAAWRTRASAEASTRASVRQGHKTIAAAAAGGTAPAPAPAGSHRPRIDDGEDVSTGMSSGSGTTGTALETRDGAGKRYGSSRHVPGAPTDVAEQPTSPETMRSLIMAAKTAVASR